MIAELYEGPDALAEVQIGVQQQAVKVIGRALAWRETEERMAEVLHALAQLAAEVDVAAGRNAEGNELARRLEILRPRGALLIGRNIFVSQEMIGALRFAQQLAEDWRGKQQEQQRDDQCDENGRFRCSGSARRVLVGRQGLEPWTR